MKTADVLVIDLPPLTPEAERRMALYEDLHRRTHAMSRFPKPPLSEEEKAAYNAKTDAAVERVAQKYLEGRKAESRLDRQLQEFYCWLDYRTPESEAERCHLKVARARAWAFNVRREEIYRAYKNWSPLGATLDRYLEACSELMNHIEDFQEKYAK